jgi:hypothetical protein
MSPHQIIEEIRSRWDAVRHGIEDGLVACRLDANAVNDALVRGDLAAAEALVKALTSQRPLSWADVPTDACDEALVELLTLLGHKYGAAIWRLDSAKASIVEAAQGDARARWSSTPPGRIHGLLETAGIRSKLIREKLAARGVAAWSAPLLMSTPPSELHLRLVDHRALGESHLDIHDFLRQKPSSGTCAGCRMVDDREVLIRADRDTYDDLGNVRPKQRVILDGEAVLEGRHVHPQCEETLHALVRIAMQYPSRDAALEADALAGRCARRALPESSAPPPPRLEVLGPHHQYAPGYGVGPDGRLMAEGEVAGPVSFDDRVTPGELADRAACADPRNRARWHALRRPLLAAMHGDTREIDAALAAGDVEAVERLVAGPRAADDSQDAPQ